jgi:hypothetical protein
MARQRETQSVPPALATPSDLGANATRDIAAALNGLLADVFALYMKTKNFHWHMSGSHFRDYHLMLDEQSDQIFAMTDVLAERVRKLAISRCTPSARYPGPRGSLTMTPHMSRHRTYWPNCARTTVNWRSGCARRTR